MRPARYAQIISPDLRPRVIYVGLAWKAVESIESADSRAVCRLPTSSAASASSTRTFRDSRH